MELTSNQHVIATTTVTVAHHGPVTASSKVESIPASNKRDKSREEKRREAIKPSAPPMDTHSSSEDSFWQQQGVRGGLIGCGGDAGPSAPAIIGLPSTMGRINSRAHVFQTKNIIRPETCGPCGRKIKFAAKVMKCVDCRAVCHPECKEDVPLPCVPMGTTPSKKMVRINMW
jgi:Rac GTPase-activating protein 1